MMEIKSVLVIGMSRASLAGLRRPARWAGNPCARAQCAPVLFSPKLPSQGFCQSTARSCVHCPCWANSDGSHDGEEGPPEPSKAQRLEELKEQRLYSAPPGKTGSEYGQVPTRAGFTT
jgi:hypothetical protein